MAATAWRPRSCCRTNTDFVFGNRTDGSALTPAMALGLGHIFWEELNDRSH